MMLKSRIGAWNLRIRMWLQGCIELKHRYEVSDRLQIQKHDAHCDKQHRDDELTNKFIRHFKDKIEVCLKKVYWL